MDARRAAFFDDVNLPGAEPVDPNYLPPPAAWLALTEPQRVMGEVLSLASVRQLLDRLPQGDGHPVMVLPGFLGSDVYNASLRRFLKSLGYRVHGWGLGRNLGPRDDALEKLLARFRMLSDRYGESLTLIGHSLGGIFARELAREDPSPGTTGDFSRQPFWQGTALRVLPGTTLRSAQPHGRDTDCP
jgi:pimeloyl-ACP methyl ester carboxylesterase